MKKQFEINKFSRNILLGLTKDLTEQQYNTIPKGFKNNIAWNLGHILVTQQQLVHGLSGIPFALELEIIKRFGKGSECETDYTLSEIESLRTQLISVIDTTEVAYNKDDFKSFKTYTTSQGFSLNNVEDAIGFSNFHEGMHLGIIIAIKKIV